MKKQVAVRFGHKALSDEIMKILQTHYTVSKLEGRSDTFEVSFDTTIEWAKEFDLFSDLVEKETSIRPVWSAVFAVDIKEPKRAAA
jgi:predicted transcriptional regulator